MTTDDPNDTPLAISPAPSTPLLRLASFWGDASFTKALTDLFSLDVKDLDRLAGLTADDFELPDVIATEFNLGAEAFTLMLAALRALHDVARDTQGGASVVLDEVRRLAAASPGQVPSSFLHRLDERQQRLLELIDLQRPVYLRNVQRRSLQRLPLATLDDVQFFLDLRVTDEDKPRLAPVVLARMTFDEPVSGISDVLSFQLTPEGLDTLKAAIERVQERLRDAEELWRQHLL